MDKNDLFLDFKDLQTTIPLIEAYELIMAINLSTSVYTYQFTAGEVATIFFQPQADAVVNANDPNNLLRLEFEMIIF